MFNRDQTTLLLCPAGKAGSYTTPQGVISIGDSAFANCTSLTSIEIGNGVTSIGYEAFSGCGRLSSAAIAGSVKTISWYSFSMCTSLTNVTFGNGLVVLGGGAFEGCDSLSAAYFAGDAPMLDDSFFGGWEQGWVIVPTFYAPVIIFYRPGTSGWGPEFSGRPTVPCGVVWGSTVRGDVSGDEIVDRNDLDLVVASRNLHAVNAEDPRDLDGDGMITVLDARILVTLFSVPGGLLHASSSPEGVVLEWAQSAGAVKLQGTTDLRNGAWQDVGDLQSSTNAVIGTSAERMFFRLVLPE